MDYNQEQMIAFLHHAEIYRKVGPVIKLTQIWPLSSVSAIMRTNSKAPENYGFLGIRWHAPD